MQLRGILANARGPVISGICRNLACSVLFGLAIVTAVARAEDQVLSLDMAIEQALGANYGQLALADQVEMAELDYVSARAAFRTKFLATSRSDVRSGAELGSRSGVFLRKRNVSGSAFSAGLYNSDFGDKSLSEMRFTYTLPVFKDKFSEGDLNLTRTDLEHVRKQNLLNIGRQELAKQVTGNYYKLIIAGDRERLAQASREIAQRSLKASQIRQSSGKLSAIDVDRTELNYLSAQQTFENAVYSRMQAEDQLKILLGLGLDDVVIIDPDTSLLVDDSLLEAPTQFLEDAALTHRIELLGKRNEVSMARKKLHNLSGSKLPAIDIDIHYALVGEGEDTQDSFDLDDQKWGVGFRMDTDFAGTERKNRRRKLYLISQAKERELEHLERKIRMEVRTAQYEARKQSRMMALRERELALARRQHEHEKILHENDQLDPVELLESERRLLEAEHQNLATRVHYLLSVMELGLATGQETTTWEY